MLSSRRFIDHDDVSILVADADAAGQFCSGAAMPLGRICTVSPA